jgi:hypothetical protein
MLDGDTSASYHAVPAVIKQESTVAILDASNRRERIIAAGQLVPIQAGELRDPRRVDSLARQRPLVADDPIERHDPSPCPLLGG